MKKVFIIATVLIFTVLSFSQTTKYSKIRVEINSKSDFQKLVESGIDVHDQLNVKQLDRPEIFVSSDEIIALQKLGLKFEILIDDWNKYFESLPKPTAAEIVSMKEKYGITGGFGYGSLGGYINYNEMVSKLDTMRLLYPNLITQKVSIGTTNESRNQWMVKITQNPDLPNSKPQILFTSLTHSREPEGLMVVLYYMFYLLEKYGIDPEVTYLVNNREIYFVPCISADGYEYNRITYPSGGGMWRKNRRNNGNGTYGVDLNRNFGPYEYWNAPNGGSSTSPGDDTYRGTAPFSEPETNNYKNFVQSKTFRACLNYHTYSNLLVYPYGALGHETADSAIFREFARDITAFNGYEYGTDLQTVGYSTRGGSDDWFYDGDPITIRPKAFSMTPEVGPSFWPDANEIFPLAIENVKPNLYMTWIVGGYPIITEKKFTKNGEFFVPGESVRLNLRLKNKGISNCDIISINVSSLSSYITIDSNATIEIESLLARSELILPQTTIFTISPATPVGSNQKIVITTTYGGVVISRDTNSIVVGAPTQLFADNLESGTSQWNLGSPAWALTTVNPHSPANSITDSPTGNYPANVNSSLTKISIIDLSQSSQAYLEFWTRWEIEAKWDFGQVQISTNGGQSWNALKGIYTKNGSGSGKQPLNQPGYDGSQLIWVKENIELSSYLGKSNVMLRFNLQADGSVQKDGWYLDDIRVLSFQISPTQTASFSTQNGWNIISLPLQTEDGRKTTLFPTAVSNAFAYDNGYYTKDTLFMGNGYWLKFNNTQSHSITGLPVNPVNITLKEGWNIIGTTNGDILVSAITTNPTGILQSSFFEFTNGYQSVQTLSKGKGYWIKSSQNGSMLLNFVPGKVISGMVPNAFINGLTISDATNQSVNLNFSNNIISEELPPVPPSGIFDARFSDNTNVNNLNNLTSFEIILNSATYPIKIKAKGINLGIKDVINGNVLDRVINDGEEITISNSQINRLHLYKIDEIPTEFSLLQNYPNSFNPTTKIEYHLAKKCKVKLELYNITGQLISTLVDAESDAGYYFYYLDMNRVNSGLATGTYIYRMITIDNITNETKSFVKKMMFMK